ncbi:hypothetical protein CYMTET_23437 [Cymbomonas tetramitiformis]|uniref:16S rRNA (uracil(1498)-N(3))-methyltransferase n=1 Tax=Cymbomonas tetramitiformis TaxID=36881 RepID=A0AAE0L0X5_9CHLO|nr:hypothetical protein CYMTET_23437 [Cymbomonas tetramitiformis]
MQLRPLIEDELSVDPPATSVSKGRPKYAMRLLLHPGEESLHLAMSRLKLQHHQARTSGAGLLLAIGPEGGWVDFELQMLERAGFSLVGMGPRILRTDVATIGAIVFVREMLASFNDEQTAE